MSRTGRAAFWATTAAVLALAGVPSVDWVTAARDYARFVSGWQPSPLRPTRTAYTPRERRAVEEPALKPSEFTLKAAKARSIELVGDFNAWKPGVLKMKRGPGALWSVVVPLRPGPHKYLFLVDGEPRVDPGAETATGPEGRRVSLRRAR